MKISKSDLLRFSKQIILKNIGIIGQKKIASAKVLVIGVGGLGCPLLLYLANTGVGNIGIIDNDRIDLSNLNRQILFNTNDVGKFKVSQAKKKIKNINNKIKVSLFKKKIEKNNIEEILDKFDIICDCTDNFTTRYLINDFCLKNKKVLISAAINKFEGQLFNFNFKKKIPCYRCFMPEISEDEKKCDADGILPTVAGIIGTLQANEVIKSVLNIKSNLTGKLIVFNSINLNFRTVKLSKNPECVKNCKNNV